MNKIITTIAIFAILAIATTTTGATNVQASSSFKDLARSIGQSLEDVGSDIDNAKAGYDQGYNDGKRAGLDGNSSDCPQSNDLSGYCLGWGSGYSRGSQSREDVNGNENSNDDD